MLDVYCREKGLSGTPRPRPNKMTASPVPCRAVLHASVNTRALWFGDLWCHHSCHAYCVTAYLPLQSRSHPGSQGARLLSQSSIPRVVFHGSQRDGMALHSTYCSKGPDDDVGLRYPWPCLIYPLDRDETSFGPVVA